MRDMMRFRAENDFWWKNIVPEHLRPSALASNVCNYGYPVELPEDALWDVIYMK